MDEQTKVPAEEVKTEGGAVTTPEATPAEGTTQPEAEVAA